MATRTFNSPGVEIRESDLSLIAPQNVGTNVFIAGYADEGPIDEVIKITSKSELEAIYGFPKNSSERYFYHSVSELLDSPADIYTYRIPYGEDNGDGFGSKYSVLAYPAVSIVDGASAADLDLTPDVASFFLGEPTHLTLTEEEYNDLKESGIQWAGTSNTSFTSVADLSGAALVILDKAQTTQNEKFEGFYVGISDNTLVDPSIDHKSITTVQALTQADSNDYTNIPDSTLQFNLTAESGGVSNSISEIMDNVTDYNIDGREDDDLLSIGVFKLKRSRYANEAFKLAYTVDSAFVGSIDPDRVQLNPSGGPSIPFFLENVDDNDRNVELFVNTNISNTFSPATGGVPSKKIRVLTEELITNYGSVSGVGESLDGITSDALDDAALLVGYADALYSLGDYNVSNSTDKKIGLLPDKLDRALESVKNDEVYDIDLVIEGGLGTIWSASSGSASPTGDVTYDENAYSTELKEAVDAIRSSKQVPSELVNDYNTIFNKFENFCNLPSNTGGRGDCMFIADPLRHIYVTGKDNKIIENKTRNFQLDIYWATRHQFAAQNTSYAATYANWGKIYDSSSGQKVWVPLSAHLGSIYARTDAAEFPWIAPAGFNRGLLTNVLEVAVNPNQKQRDELYKSNLNPIYFSKAEGITVMGQKTLSRKPSAFDRVNVRRLFLALERPTKKASKYFLFEPNNEFTRTRFEQTLIPIMEFAKQNGGVYDYQIIVDERVNTPQVIDNNEMRATVLLKPTRAAEFIIVEFVATRTDANFQEIVQ